MAGGEPLTQDADPSRTNGAGIARPSGDERESSPVVKTIAARRLSPGRLYAARVAVLVAFLALWEYLPKIGWVQENIHFLNELYISKPSAILVKTVELVTASGTAPSVWPYLGRTMQSTFVGGVVGVVVGALLGLLLSNYQWLSDIVRPYLVALNCIPKIALIPVVILIAGPTVQGTSISAAIIVVFVVFFNAYEGGRSVKKTIIENVALHGASRRQLMWRVRAPYVSVWTLAALPNAISFSLVGVVTTEILSGVQGLGYFILQGLTNLDSALIFAVVLILCAVGVLLVSGTDLLARRMSHGIDIYSDSAKG